MARILGVSWQSHHRQASHARSGGLKEQCSGDGEHKITLTSSSASIGQLGGHSQKGRTDSEGEMAKGWDHDPPARRRWTPLGILVLATGALTLLFGQGDTSDYWADGLKRWWESVKGQYGHIKRLVIYLDNGPQDRK